MPDASKPLANLPITEHIAHHFALDLIQYDLRESEHSLREGDFEPAVTADELTAGLVTTGEIGKTFGAGMPNGTRFDLPAYPTQIDAEGYEQFVHIDKVTELGNQLNAVLVLIAASIALKKASENALMEAVALREYFGLNDHASPFSKSEKPCPCGGNNGSPCPECGVLRHDHYDDEFGSIELCLNPACSTDR